MTDDPAAGGSFREQEQVQTLVQAGRARLLAEAGVDGQLADTAADELEALCLGSNWAIEYLCRHPGLLSEILAAEQHRTTPSRAELAAALELHLTAAGDDVDPSGDLGRALRSFRNRHMIGILLRDLGGHADLPTTTAALSDLADLIIAATLARLMDAAVAEWGEPLDQDGARQELIVVAMGKLGAGELNLSSDVDLVFAFPESGLVTGGVGITCQEFFTRVGRRLIGLLDARTPQGFVFRVDMRLRPFGEAGPLAQHTQAMLDYYQEQGRDWERYALIKARAITGAPASVRRLVEGLRPFVFRRYLDFGAIASLREMKAMIRREVQRRGLAEDVKLGEGGIREVEFVAQVYQLIHGGRDRSLQTRALLDVLPQLADAQLMAATDARDLDLAYRFLRDVEHRIQALDDAQSQSLPADDITRARIARSMRFADLACFEGALAAHRRAVAACFEELIAPAVVDDPADVIGGELWRQLWLSVVADAAGDEEEATLARLGYAEPAAALARLQALAQRREAVMTQEVGRQRLDELMPLLLDELAGSDGPDAALERALRLIEAVLRRTAYLVLLLENPDALAQLVRLCAGSERIAVALARHPVLLDELLDPRQLYSVPTREALAAELKEMTADIPDDDLEAQMEQSRYFKVATELRIAACELSDVLPLMKVSDTLSWLAEVILDAAIALAWRETVDQYGAPADARGAPSELAFGVVGYGKLGGLELGWGSDLDLVFLHDLPGTGTTCGERRVSNGQFMARMGQRLIHLLSTRTFTGQLYEVDLRLRPSGRSGVLVSSVEAFATYQRQDAWTWEHQALVRARPVAGAPRVLAAFAAVRSEILSRARVLAVLRVEVAEMRDRMLAEHRLVRAPHAQGPRSEIDLKQAPGGVVDIEFMVQFLVLGWARAHPDLLLHTDAIRTLETAISERLLAASDAELLVESYKAFRAEAHRKALLDQPARTERADLLERAQSVAELWSRLMTPAREGPAGAGAI